MPTFEFVCSTCSHRFSKFTTIDKKQNVKCPSCSSKKVKQIFTTVNFTAASCSSKNKSCAGSCGNCSGC